MSRILIVLMLASVLADPLPAASRRAAVILSRAPGGVPRAALAEEDPCAGAQPIASVRKEPAGAKVTVRGSVTVSTGVFTPDRSFAVQDATGGIYVYGASVAGLTLDPGDRVCVTGALALFHGLTEITPGSKPDVVLLGHGAPPAPASLDPAQVGEHTEGLLVSITGPASDLDSNPFRVGGVPVYLDRDTGATSEGLVEGCTVTVTGLSSDYDGFQIWPRAQEDIVAPNCPLRPCAGLTVAQIQGEGAASPYEGEQDLGCLSACVTGIASDGFYLQSATPDGDPRTSEGIFLFRHDGWTNPQSLAPGDLVEVRGFDIQEFYGSTEIVGLRDDTRASYRRTGTCALPDPIPVPTLADPNVDPEAVYEPYEGMRVSMDFDGAVSGPTTRYPGRFPGGEAEIALVDRGSPLYGRRIFASDLPAGRGMIFLSGALGRDLPDAGIGDRLWGRNVTGILAYQFGRYVLLVDSESPSIVVEDVPGALEQEMPIGEDEFAICSFNVENLFDEVDDGDGDMGDWAPADRSAFELSLAKRAAAIRDDLQGCTVVGLQEVEGKDAVWQALAGAVGEEFHYDYFESVDERDITCGILYDASRVALLRSEPSQFCTPTDYGVNNLWAVGPRARVDRCPSGAYPLFDRPPYVADLAVRSAGGDRGIEVRVIVNHFKSKLGDETVNQVQRLAQARHVASLLTGANAVALGDLNDSLDTRTLAQFAGLVNLFEAHLPRADHYTYVYNGQSEVLDHFIMTPGLDRYFKSGGPVHINADFPDPREPDRTGRRSSDHDPIMVRFAFRPTGVSEALAGLVTGAAAGMAGP
jgi:predicted extracellular nuclease